MDLYASIARRKSCRKYDMQPLGQETMTAIEDAIKGFTPLYADVPLAWRYTSRVNGRFHVEAPHYLIISGKGKSGEAENAGFLFEQLALWFDAMEIGCVWLGGAKDAQAGSTEGDMITIGFGKTLEPVHRERAAFKRTPIEKITNAPDDMCVQAAHLAPSGMNTQPWFFEKMEGKTLVYEQKLRPPISLIYKHSDIDMGIGLCHYAMACRQTGRQFTFARAEDLPQKRGYMPFGVITG